ncbi:nucleotidyltransferase family protein [Helicovermis profundi]|uniref:Molybdenum cofactor cytidylyltransferase n=1 Tax=Helicovermis profundi TaxID=3065157 RepID=A0AAU9E8D2_9FIRM|nr:molybdenum cofactor cytidylyltransferase [Clostridia bacterium S502]
MVTGIIMASGLSKRMGENKLLIKINNKRIIDFVLENALKSKLDEIILIYANDEIIKQIKSEKVIFVKNFKNVLGQSESIKLGIENANKNTCGICFLVADQPLLTTKTINTLVDKFKEFNDKIIVPIYDGNRSTPVIFPISLKDEFMKLKGDIGGREIIKNNRDKIITCNIKNSFEGIDIDCKEDINRVIKIINREILEEKLDI